MRQGARRLAFRKGTARASCSTMALCAVLTSFALPLSGAGDDGTIVSARYTEPTTRYAHGILGDAIEHGALELELAGAASRRVLRLPMTRVFEDTEPRVVDVDGDGRAEVVVVEAHQDQGARLAIYNASGLVAATPYIGTRNRWLAPVAVADMDGDGAVEIAYVDRPHLAKILRVWRYENGQLAEIAALEGVTNHRIGERDIAGGLRDCGAGPEMIVASADWQRLMAVSLTAGTLVAHDIGPHNDRASFAAALAC
ncbi:FG-GAP repeat domain-containing protein [Sulfitobacter guttiformis]|uniref:VCBS repeat protein n=1 Tax=Sulfitobacter guttiformis TaxID=74349 RepID=A0A420DJP7_9RHOB|nr:VCBS repeat-containing protein [Sulfitobacter guttiformis]KIN71736.1 FG-GAP repeat-containing protein [Sulfitobacter guttiformis KCTC 32187]RKE94442.1 VCBS repeat protein [Sulfitobacter guttiformis]